MEIVMHWVERIIGDHEEQSTITVGDHEVQSTITIGGHKDRSKFAAVSIDAIDGLKALC